MRGNNVLRLAFVILLLGSVNSAWADNPVCLSSNEAEGIRLHSGLLSRDGPVPQNGKNWKIREDDTERYRSGPWLALACKKKQCRLARIELKTRTIHPVDDYNGCSVYQNLTWGLSILDKNERVIMLFQPDPALKEGQVATWYIKPNQQFIPFWERDSKVDETIRIPTPTETNHDRVSILSTLWVNSSQCSKKQEKESECLRKTVRIQLSEGGVKQWLTAPFKGAPETANCLALMSDAVNTYFNRDYLIWVGDLDGDQRPDYLMASDDLDLWADILFLSSKAGPQQLVEKAGSHWTLTTCD